MIDLAAGDETAGDGRAVDAGRLVQAYLADQVEELLAHEPGVRAGDGNAVHDMRVATRRLRSALATFRPVLRRERTDPLRDELRRLGRHLGEARDADVSGDGLLALLEETPEGLVLGPVRARLDGDRRAAFDVALSQLVAVLDSPAWAGLSARLGGLATDPPVVTESAGAVEDRLLPRVDRAFRRLRRAWRAARAEAPGALRDMALHEARKDARQARYAAEALAPVIGPAATRSARAAEQVQEVLGHHQDLVVARAVLRRVAFDAHAAGESAFTYGLLHERAAARSVALDQRLPRVARRATARGRHEWMR
ncbi:CHAD domain-containing protein [Cellulomonas chengniuliangii]|uniref:CHAD domain-containing protein n=2 Tax=Cellulomonas chengniuliangii TaxID=2968084 RepID=A0ABY5L0W0_9CELL|nr:CHAD domain-containing protein [Cellulomonas chengniuliangii]UUI76400.1 CHAD domain-containing protein [Cellulomonas chengniuliangii]